MDVREFSLDAFSLAGKNAVITGGNTGLGQAFTLALAKAGADVFVPSVLDDGGATRELVEATGRRMEFLPTDLTADGGPRAAIEACVSRLGSVDVLVNSAGICRTAPVAEFGRAEWDPMVDINLTVPFELSREAARFMTAQGSGKIINIASLFSFLGGQWSPAYAATKHAIVGFTKTYCDELAQHGIQVNAIAPGYFATAITEQTRADPVASRRVLDHIPAGRWGEVADLMGTTVFLASRASDYVNGQVLAVDGGYLTR
ncbi:SDR family oxidoreductase [Saccharopolyspora gloriosae]|uniref:NAD(P)-dependent dehydrogenase (Short-subunit alcohol dehydrogenase family) n=1 Tax=Saccharopolyspora gloriosae TaxID=455344 RepID=A0A840NE85_9PSEU|nr:SDR family oxidoreductase [Saccharopolyspora gloriosae]MBB5070240.1 NAD(P)-dependent dehydrogenase (short-subunit alcohol dehydrogenase family) [Saccharopolyspora gloriosae]